MYILLYLLSLFPIRLLYVLSDILYLLIYKIGRYRTEVVFTNLQRSFPDKDNVEIRKIQDRFYHCFFDVIIESIKSISASKDFFKKRVIFKNIDVFNKYHKNNQSTVLAVAHYGNWEWGLLAISISAQQKMTGVYKKLNNRFFNKYLHNIRSRFGANLLEMKDILRYIIANKEPCEIIGLLADQSPVKSESNYWTTFLNQDTSVYLGPEKISIKMDYPVLFCNMQRVRRGYYEIEIEELCINPKKTTKGEITSLYLRKIEQKINNHPEFWLWTHRRWKHKK